MAAREASSQEVTAETSEGTSPGRWTPIVDDPPAEVLELEDLAVIDEVTHPMRGRVLRRLKQPRTVAELAEELDVPVTRLYHHVNRLEDTGLIRVVATRRVGAATERRYQVIAKSFRIAHHLFDELDPRELARAMGGLFDLAKLGLQRSVESGLMRGVDLEEHGLLSLGEVRLRPERRIEVLRRLRELLTEYESEEGGDPLTLFVAAYRESR